MEQQQASCGILAQMPPSLRWLSFSLPGNLLGQDVAEPEVSMGESPVVTTLIRLRGKMAGELSYNEKRQTQLRADLAHVDAVLRMLGQLEPESIPNRRFATQWFKRGDTKRAVLEILREADKPLTAMQIGARVLEKQGLDPNDRRAQGRIRQSVLNALRKCRDVACEVGVNKEKWWRIAD